MQDMDELVATEERYEAKTLTYIGEFFFVVSLNLKTIWNCNPIISIRWVGHLSKDDCLIQLEFSSLSMQVIQPI